MDLENPLMYEVENEWCDTILQFVRIRACVVDWASEEPFKFSVFREKLLKISRPMRKNEDIQRFSSKSFDLRYIENPVPLTIENGVEWINFRD
jgi:hypothetical protein